MKTTLSSESNRRPARSPWLWPMLIVLLAAAALVVTFAGVDGPIRTLFALGFLLAGPGMAVVGLLQLRDGVAEWTLIIAVSLAVSALVAGTMAYIRMWSPEGGLVVLAVLSVAGALFQLGRAFREQSSSAG